MDMIGGTDINMDCKCVEKIECNGQRRIHYKYIKIYNYIALKSKKL